MRFLLAILILLLISPVYAQIGFFSYSEWASSDEATREAYIAGASDSYVIIANVGSPSQKTASEAQGHAHPAGDQPPTTIAAPAMRAPRQRATNRSEDESRGGRPHDLPFSMR
jgi:hypothetical protein